MPFLDKLRKWFSPAKSPDKNIESVLLQCIEIVDAYGTVLEQANRHPMVTSRPESDLPFSKEIISQAILLLQHALTDPRRRAILIRALPPELAQHALSAKYGESLKVSAILLDDFVPRDQFEADRQQGDEFMRLADKLEPGARARLEQIAAGNKPRP